MGVYLLTVESNHPFCGSQSDPIDSTASTTADDPMPRTTQQRVDEQLAFSCDVLRMIASKLRSPNPDYMSLAVLINREPSVWSAYAGKCECRASATHGEGVFAKCRILAGEAITLYPIDIIYPHTPGVQLAENETYKGNHITEARAHQLARDICFMYNAQQAGCVVVADSQQHRNDALFLGHMINDGAKLSLQNTPERLVAARSIYAACSAAKRNCILTNFTNKHGQLFVVAAVATRDIAPGEELFLTYGGDYWEAVAMRVHTK